MKANVRLINNKENQAIARQIRDYNLRTGNTVSISFEENLSEIVFSGEKILIPHKYWNKDNLIIEGEAKKEENDCLIEPSEKGKTVNLHLDAELVDELNKIKEHVLSKTQHEIVLELFKKGLHQYKRENQ
ncbi:MULTISPECIES: hypothetical protein [Bacillus]|uniref:Uncharacterized protein n=2 Tax=Bacillus TaxID=1386 RepID=A0A0M4FYM6_9BACI|nr:MULTISPECIES: hypothetical protein [Bacillus]ALC82488.1 hypothetical protein AM592_13510 [Bacillus gobiensis]MBP1081380.1 hypothetical protein [Bacillus capparidis]MED1096053.1 hypothetical protein [Bacillus capparidis]